MSEMSRRNLIRGAARADPLPENRSFDMYFGTLKGVIGYGDKATITLPGGYSVFQQPTSKPGRPVTGTQYPFQLSKGKVTSSPLTTR
jgi:phospholipase C